MVRLRLIDENFGFCIQRAKPGNSYSAMPDPTLVATVAMAGYAAEILWCGHYPGPYPDEDLQAVLQLGFCWRSIENCVEEATKMLRANESSVHSVADALMRRGELRRRGFLAALR